MNSSSSKRTWITDAGQPLVVTTQAGEQLNIGRYGVWQTDARGKASVVEAGDDLQLLQARYGPGLELRALQQLLEPRTPSTTTAVAPNVDEARQFALAAHGDQRYGNQPYSVHLEAVVNNVQVYLQPHTVEQLCAAWLHDVLEDTQVKEVDIGFNFGRRVLELVQRLTDERIGANRKERQARTHAKTREDAEAVGIKLCDRLANARSSALGMFSKDDDQARSHRGLYAMYKKEYPAFRQVMWRPDEYPELWHELDNLLLREEKNR